ncbi:hypothetical protein [Mesoterricola silvestris]|uniref:hypothetical protein n=1 Tax=Mesoterricola silvestris TaxID=2927979 RepID=UPI00292F70A0|nr:hypothetical protein [Mesoterricola silvestris]
MPNKQPAIQNRLSDKSITRILETLDSWRGPLTWNLLLDVVAVLLGHRFTRQALWNHESIRLAFGVRQSISVKQAKAQPRGSLGLIAAHERIATLQAKVARLEEANERLKVQFIRWAHNAHKRGLDEDFLNQPLPAIDREKSKIGLVGKGRRRM